jgi:hypothetical protein
MKISILIIFLSIVHFCLPKNEPKRAADHLVPRCGTPQRCSQKTGDIEKSLHSAESLIRFLLRCLAA